MADRYEKEARYRRTPSHNEDSSGRHRDSKHYQTSDHRAKSYSRRREDSSGRHRGSSPGRDSYSANLSRRDRYQDEGRYRYAQPGATERRTSKRSASPSWRDRGSRPRRPSPYSSSSESRSPTRSKSSWKRSRSRSPPSFSESRVAATKHERFEYSSDLKAERISPSYSPPRSTLKAERTDGVIVLSEVKKSRSPGPSSSMWYTEDDNKALDSLYCKICEVKLHDRGSMKSHIDGRRHLAMKSKIADNFQRQSTGRSDTIKTDPANNVTYDDQYWMRTNNEKKVQMYNDPSLAKVFDTESYDKMAPKFEKGRYDHGQFKNSSKDMYCKLCGVTVASRDVMENHKQGEKHLRLAAEIKRFECKICTVSVPCQNTLDNHMRGKDHIKRVREIEEKKKKERWNGSRSGGNKLSRNDKYLSKDLEKENADLQAEMKSLMMKNMECKSKHHQIEATLKEIGAVLKEKERLAEDNRNLERKISSLNRSKQSVPCRSSKMEPKATGEYSEHTGVKAELKQEWNFSDTSEIILD